MKGKHGLVLLIVAALTMGLGACGNGEAKEEGHLKQALAMVPADADSVYFTDWALIKAYEGVPGLSSESSMDERTAFIVTAFVGNAAKQVPPRQAAASKYGLNRFQTHEEIWSWDSTDLVWEATIEVGSAPPAYVLQFPQDFDFAPLLALFDERGFSQNEYQEVTIYSHEMDLGAEWMRKSEFGILNTAVLEGEKRLALSAAIEGVRAILDVQKGGAKALIEDPAVEATAERLDQVASAFISSGVDACVSSGDPLQALMGEELSDEQLARLKALLKEDLGVHLYTGLGIGYRYEENRPVGLIVMHYTNADAAQADLEPRRQLAQEGISLVVGQAYSEVLFTLDEATVKKNDLTLQVRPVNDTPQRLFIMISQRDMLFARCP